MALSAEFPDVMHCPPEREASAPLCAKDQDWTVKDWVARDYHYGRHSYAINGVPISHERESCCINDPNLCRYDIIFYDGQAYGQKHFLEAHLRNRPGNVMNLEGKLVPPFNSGKSVQKWSPYRSRDLYPTTMCFNDNPLGKGLSPCCTTSIYNDQVPPYHNTQNLGFSRKGLPYGETLGFFRFKPNKISDCQEIPVQRLGECCTCEPGEYNPALYVQDDCPPRECCC